jgi:MFS family permease
MAAEPILYPTGPWSAAFAWYRTLSSAGRRAFWAGTGGYALACFDLLAFTFVLGPVAATFGLSPGQVGLLSTASLLASVVGGIIGGALADRLGRVRVLMITIAVYAGCTFLCGLAQSYEQLLALRLLLGLGFGGEWTAGALITSEYAAPAQRGRVQGWFSSAYSVGNAIAAVAYALTASLLPPALAWRALFWVGVLPALLIFWMRTRATDPPIYHASRAAHATPSLGGAAGAARAPLAGSPVRDTIVQLFKPQFLLLTIAASVLCIGVLSGKNIVNLWLPNYLQDASHSSGASTSLQLAPVLLGGFVGSLLGGYCQDWLGRRRTFALFSLGSAAALVAYVQVPVGVELALAVAGIPLGLFTAGAISGLSAYISELYPTGIRGTAQGFAYNLGRGASGVFTTGIGFAAAGPGLGILIALGAIVYVVSLGALRFLPETRGSQLRSD